MILKVLLHISHDNSILKPDELPFASPKKKALFWYRNSYLLGDPVFSQISFRFIILNEFYEVVLRVVDLQAELLLLEIFEYRMNVVKGFVDILPDFGSSQDNLSRDKNE